MVGLEDSNCKLINLGTKNSVLSITYSTPLNYWLESSEISIFKVQNVKMEKEVGICEWKGNFRAISIFSKVKKGIYFTKMCFYFMKLCFFSFFFLENHSMRPVKYPNFNPVLIFKMANKKFRLNLAYVTGQTYWVFKGTWPTAWSGDPPR